MLKNISDELEKIFPRIEFCLQHGDRLIFIEWKEGPCKKQVADILINFDVDFYLTHFVEIVN
jgi:hypothetical protein